MKVLSSTIDEDDHGGDADKENQRTLKKPFHSSSDDSLQRCLPHALTATASDHLQGPPGFSPPERAQPRDIDSRLHDVEPLLAASPNILNKGSCGRNRVQKGVGNPPAVGALYRISYTSPQPRNGFSSSGNATPNSETSGSDLHPKDKINNRLLADSVTTLETKKEVNELGDKKISSSLHSRLEPVSSSSSLEATGQSFMSPLPGRKSNSYRLTPCTPRTNPFDVCDPSELTMSIVSPSVFCISKERSKNGSHTERDPSETTNSAQVGDSPDHLKPFRWSIDQLAILYPADIDITDKEVSRQEIHKTPDIEYERKVDAAIDEYFSQNLIVPSPWIGQSGAKYQSRLPNIMECNGSPMLCVNHASSVLEIPQTDANASAMNVTTSNARLNKSANTSTQVNVREVSCQTKLTIPVDVDLERLLADYYSATEEVVIIQSNDSSFTSRNTSLTNDCSGGAPISSDVLSTSTLRRKLFTHLEEEEEKRLGETATSGGEKEGAKISQVRRSRSGSNLKVGALFHDPAVSGQTPPKAISIEGDEATTPSCLQYVATSPIRESAKTRPRCGSPRQRISSRGCNSFQDLSIPLSPNMSSIAMDVGSSKKDHQSKRAGEFSPLRSLPRPAIHSSSSPVPRPPRSPLSRPPIPFELVTPPSVRRFSISTGREVDALASPDVSPIKGIERGCPGNQSHPDDNDHHEDDDPTPRSFGRFLELGEGERTELASGMEVDTPMKFKKSALDLSRSRSSNLDFSRFADQTSNPDSMMETSNSDFFAVKPLLSPSNGTKPTRIESSEVTATLEATSAGVNSFPSQPINSVVPPSFSTSSSTFDSDWSSLNARPLKWGEPLYLSTPLTTEILNSTGIPTQGAFFDSDNFLKNSTLSLVSNDSELDVERKPLQLMHLKLGTKVLHFSRENGENFSGTHPTAAEVSNSSNTTTPSAGNLSNIRSDDAPTSSHQLSWVAPLVASTPTRRQLDAD